MNLYEQNILFEEKYSEYDNIFSAVNDFSNLANKCYRQYGGLLDYSECLTYVLTGKLPDNLELRRPAKLSNSRYLSKYIKECLCYVDDNKVEQSVWLSIKHSLINSNLNFVYVPNLSCSQSARVRILCRMIWTNLMKGVKDG